jgi:hypothetical protein
MGLPHKEVGRPQKVVGDRRSKELGRREERGKSPKAREKITVSKCNEKHYYFGFSKLNRKR